MPEISRFFGMVVAMYYNDHAPPHFHVRYAKQKAVIEIDPLQLLEGNLSPKARALVFEWAKDNREELLANWQLAREKAPFKPSILWSNTVLLDIVEAIPLEGHRLKLRFEDGTTGIVDVAQCVSFEGVFAPLRDPIRFAAVQVNPELGTVCWPGGADLDPDVLYALISGTPITLESSKA
jgi:hypothetical protein